MLQLHRACLLIITVIIRVDHNTHSEGRGRLCRALGIAARARRPAVTPRIVARQFRQATIAVMWLFITVPLCAKYQHHLARISVSVVALLLVFAVLTSSK
jgi:hypothetical protein